MKTNANKTRPFILAFVFVGLHTALLLLITLLVALSKDPEAGMAYYIFYYIDHPLSRQAGLGTIVFGGSALWFLYGLAIQSLCFIRSKKHFFHLAASICGILLLFAIPELRLKSMPEWKEHWERGTEAREAENIDLAIQHVRRAADLAPLETDILDGIWDYLGRLYLDNKDFDEAGKAFHQALIVVEKQKRSRPIDYLHAHNRLSSFYERIEDLDQEAIHLKKSAEYNRIVYEGDSTQEAGCWHRLAEVAHQRGDSKEAGELLTKAITMESNLENTHAWSLNYMKEQLQEWEIEQIK